MRNTTVELPTLKVDIECMIPGPNLTSEERSALAALAKHAERVGMLLMANHQPAQYEQWRKEHELKPGPYAGASQVPETEAEVIPIRPGVIEDGKDPVAFGRGLAALRKREDMSRMQLKVLAGLSYPYMSEVELGNKWPTENAIAGLARAFEMTPGQLVSVCLQLGGASG